MKEKEKKKKFIEEYEKFPLGILEEEYARIPVPLYYFNKDICLLALINFDLKLLKNIFYQNFLLYRTRIENKII